MPDQVNAASNASAGAAVDVEEMNRRVLTGSGPARVKGATQTSLLDQLDNKDKVIKTVLSRAKYAGDYRRPFEEEWHRSFLAMFQVFATPLESSWNSQRYIPLILSNVETALSVIGTVVVDGQKLCRFQSETQEGKDCARAHEALQDWQNKGPTKTERHILDAEWWGLVTGTAMIDTGWENEESNEIVAVVEGEGANRQKVMRTKPVTVSDHPFVKALNPLDVYLCPHSGIGTDHEWIVQRVRCTMGEVRAAEGKGHINKEAVDSWVAESRPTDGKPGADTGFDAYLGPKLLDVWLNEVGKSNPTDQGGDDEDGAADDKLVELLVYRSKREIITLGSSSRIIGYSKSPWKHRKVGIVTNPYIPIKGCPYGRALAGMLLGHQELLNANVNLFADVLMVSMMRPMVVDRSLISVLDDEVIFEPNALLRARMNAKDAIVPLDIPAPTNLFLLWDNHLKRDADDTGGFTEQARGVAPTNSPTATEFTGVQSNIQNRLKIHVLRLKWFVEDICGLLKQLNEQFYTQAQVVSVAGESGMTWRKIEPWELVGEVTCQATTSPKYANADLHVQRQLQILQILVPLLSQGNMNPAVVRLLRGILRAANTDDIDLILPAGMETAKSWVAENEYLLRGGDVKPTIAEVRSGATSDHVRGHQAFLDEISQNPNIPPDVLNNFAEHIQAHMVLEQQFGQAAAQQAQLQAGGMAGAQTAGDPGRQAQTAMGQAQGGGGIPGEASPGPSGPLGRPMGA